MTLPGTGRIRRRDPGARITGLTLTRRLAGAGWPPSPGGDGAERRRQGGSAPGRRLGGARVRAASTSPVAAAAGACGDPGPPGPGLTLLLPK